MSYLDAAQPGPQCTVGPLPIVGNPRSFSVLAAEGNRHLSQRERKSRRCGLVVPEIGAELARGQISVWARELVGWGPEGQPRTPWSCGQLGWRLLSLCRVSRAGSGASSQVFRIPVLLCIILMGSSLGKEREHCVGKSKGNSESFKTLVWASKRPSRDSERDSETRLCWFLIGPSMFCLSLQIHTSPCSGSGLFQHISRLLCLLAAVWAQPMVVYGWEARGEEGWEIFSLGSLHRLAVCLDWHSVIFLRRLLLQNSFQVQVTIFPLSLQA